MTDNSNTVAPRLKRRQAKKRALSAVEEQQVRQWIDFAHSTQTPLDRTSQAGRCIRSMDQSRGRYLRSLEFEEDIRKSRSVVTFDPLVDAPPRPHLPVGGPTRGRC